MSTPEEHLSPQILELNWYPKGSSFYQKYHAGSELDHIGFAVDDAVKWYYRLLKRGAESAAEPFGSESWTLAYVKDPDGIWIEFIGQGRKPARLRKAKKTKLVSLSKITRDEEAPKQYIQ